MYSHRSSMLIQGFSNLARLILIVVVFIHVLTHCNGQNIGVLSMEVIKYDLKNENFPSQLPFHKSFILRVITDEPIRAEDLKIYEVEFGSTFRQVGIWNVVRQYQVMSRILNPGTISDTTDIIVGSLEPHKYYDIQIITQLNIDELNRLITVSDELDQRTRNGIPIPAIPPREFVNIRNSINSSLINRNLGHQQIFNINWPQFRTFYTNQLLPLYNQLFALPVLFVPISGQADIQQAEWRTRNLKIKNANFGPYDDFFNGIPAVPTNVLSGYISIDSVNLGASADTYDLSSRLANLESTKKYLNGLISAIDEIIIRAGGLVILRADLIRLSQIISQNILRIQTIQSNLNNEFNTYSIGGRPAFRSGIWIQAPTKHIDFNQKNKTVAIPDFGIVGIFAQQNNGERIFIPRPYLGINVSPRGINKYTPFKELETDQRFWYYLNFSAGVAIGGFNEQDFESLFLNLVGTTGLTLRLSPQGRIGAGVSYFKEKHPNPIINKSNVEVGGYFMLSLDLEALDSVAKLLGKIFGS